MEIDDSQTSLTASVADSAAKLIAQSSVNLVGEPAPLGLTLDQAPDNASVFIKGLLPGMELSTGAPSGDGVWQLPAKDLKYAWIAPPPDFVGTADLVAELRLANFQMADRQSVRVEWTRQSQPIERTREQGLATQTEDFPPVRPSTGMQDRKGPGLGVTAPPTTVKPSQSTRPNGSVESNGVGARRKVELPRSVERGRDARSERPSEGQRLLVPKGFWDWSR
jgi:YD repeat-containing protein